MLLDEGLLTPEELEAAIATQIGSSRVSFLGGREIWVKGVLDLGVDPRCGAFALLVYALDTQWSCQQSRVCRRCV